MEKKQRLLSPIVAVLGHVDHGKTSLLDAIRGTSITEKEPGKITQMIGASFISKKTIETLSKDIRKILKIDIKVPGLLFIDTPGHEAFTSMRIRGGSIANIAVLVIDIMQSIEEQTKESIEILKKYKTPFIVALTKVDLIDGWISTNQPSILKSMQQQTEQTLKILDEKIYSIAGHLSQFGFSPERFDRVKDFTKELSLIPISSKTKEGLAELLLLLVGLSQKYLKDKLIIKEDEKPKATIIEVKEEKGLGTTVDVILHEGILRKGQVVAFLSKEGIKKTKIRALLLPNTASNNPKEKYKYVDEITAAAGVKIFAPQLEGAIPGSPLVYASSELIKELKEAESRWKFQTEKEGVVVKVDSIGSAEAILKLFQKEKIKISKLDIGPVSKEDITYATSIKEKNSVYGVVLAFNTKVEKEAYSYAQKENIPIIWNNIIYKLVENYREWVKNHLEEKKKKATEQHPYPSKIKVLGEKFFFRKSNPAIFGVEVIEGTLKSGIKLMDEEGNVLGEVKSIQENKNTIKEAQKGKKVAISVSSITLGKHVKPSQLLYSYLSEKDISFWEKNKTLINGHLLEEIKQIINKAKIKKKLKDHIQP